MSAETQNKTTFLNVDLEIESRVSLKRLKKAFGRKVLVLHHEATPERNLLIVERSSGRQLDADDTIHNLCDFVEKLPNAARKVWKSARKRGFDVGYDFPVKERMVRFTLRNDSLRRVAKLGGVLTVTFYRDFPPVVADRKVKAASLKLKSELSKNKI